MAYTPTLWAKGDKVTSAKLNKIEQGIVDKVDKETGKTLSTNDFTDAYKTKLEGIEANADKTTIDATLTSSGAAADAKATGDAIKGIETDLDGKVATIESNLDEKVENLKSLVGTPLKATTASDMTDTSKIYVYTGNESGYTNGDWYYHDGSAWVDGGTYNSVAVEVDKTLTVDGMPADAKVTGDEIGALKSGFTQLEAGSLSAVGAEKGNVPVANGDGTWEWDGNVNDIQDAIDRLNVLIGSADLLTWEQRMEYVRNGYGAEMFPVGTRFSTLHDSLGSIQWDVVDHDHFQMPSDRQAHTMTLMTRFIVPRPFNPTILNYQCAIFAAKTNALPAGNYKFTASCHLSATTNNGKVFYFTTSEDLPIGGQIRPYQWEIGGSLVGTDIFAAYESPTSTEPMFTIDVANVALNDAVDLADITDGMYQYSGYCEAGAFDYSDTDLREWLNSDQEAGAWRTLKTPLHHAPYPNVYERRAQTGWFEDTDGFVRGFGSDFLDVVKAVEYPCAAQAMSVAHESVESYSVIDRFIIPSAAELGLSREPLVGNALKFFEGADYAKRIKYQNANSRNGSAYPTRSVIGNAGRYGAGIRHINTAGSEAIYLPATLQLVIICTLG